LIATKLEHFNGESLVPQTAEVRVADRLHQLRLDKGLTLAQLAAAAAMSQAFLSRVENHKASLPIAGLERVAKALGVPIAVFFQEDHQEMPISVCRAGRGSKGRIRGPRGFVFELLAGEKKGKLMEPIIADIATASRPVPLKSHPGEEFDYVIEGECILLYGKEQIHLRRGDAAYYDATVPHAARAIKGKPCRILAVVASRDYLFHGDLPRLLNEPTT
jgi:transcriptional regulator with XRE-family HTH domain